MSNATEIELVASPPQPAEELPAFVPVAKADRLVNLDFVRGMALLGILVVNANFIFAPITSFTDPAFRAALPPREAGVALLIQALFLSKFISIFSMLFGYGLLGQIERAAEHGHSPVEFTLARLGALAGFGLVHALLIWYGDILFVYATVGGWLLLARRASAGMLLLVAFGLLLVTLLLLIGVEGLTIASWGEPAAQPDGTAPRGLAAIREAQYDPSSPVWVEAEVAAYRDGPWRDAQAFRVVEWLMNLAYSLVCQGWLALGMMFLGGALWRLRFFAPEQETLRRQVVGMCLPLGLALEALAAWFSWPTGPGDRWGPAVGHVVQQLGLFFLPLGYLGAFALLADRLPGRVRWPIASAGRMSLTVYLLESVLATALSYHWGFRLFGRTGPALQTLIAFSLWLALVVFSHIWLKRFPQGPMEWLWRRVAYGRGKTLA